MDFQVLLKEFKRNKTAAWVELKPGDWTETGLISHVGDDYFSLYKGNNTTIHIPFHAVLYIMAAKEVKQK